VNSSRGMSASDIEASQATVPSGRMILPSALPRRPRSLSILPTIRSGVRVADHRDAGHDFVQHRGEYAAMNDAGVTLVMGWHRVIAHDLEFPVVLELHVQPNRVAAAAYEAHF
jgi:hypothetical protein